METARFEESLFYFSEEPKHFKTFKQAFNYLNQKKDKILVLIDEYPDLKLLEPHETIDSEFRQISDNLSDNIKLVISGSQMDMMKNMLEEKIHFLEDSA